MEDMLVRNAWFTSIGTALCAFGISAAAVYASPAGMRIAARPTTKADASSGAARASQPARPSTRISPWKNPIQYMGAAVSELPIGIPFVSDKDDRPSLHAAKPPADSIALNQPVGPPTPQWTIAIAQVAERQGDAARAREQYQQALRMWPGNVELLRAAARMEDRQGNLPLAESLYQQAAAANPQHAASLNDLGLCHARQGKLEASVSVIEQAIQLQPDKALYRNNAATVLVEMRQDQRALVHLAAVHGAAEAHYNMGQLLANRGRAAEAAPYFQTALEHDPTMQAAQIALAKLHGGQVGDSAEWTPTWAPTMAPQRVAPEDASQFAPQVGPQSQPDLQFPATAQTPGYNASSYVPPGYQAPRTPHPTVATPRIGNAAPRFLPPVASPGRGFQR
jgi:tetratricopeptide (TPR) repeat protein